MLRVLALLIAALASATSLLAAVGLAVVSAGGERLASLARKFVPELEGKLEYKAIDLEPRALLDFATDKPTPIVVTGLKITDPEGTVVLAAPRLALKIRPRSATSGRIYLSDVELGPGSVWRFAQMKRSEDNGFLRALQPRRKPGAKPAPKAAPSASADRFHFEIVNANLDGLTAHFDFPAWGLELRNIKAPATLLVEEEAKGMFVGWDVKNLDARGGGWLRILEERLPFNHVLVTRVATLRERPNDIYLDLQAARTGRSTLVGRGSFTGIYGYAGSLAPPGIDMHAEFANAADALSAVAAPHKIPGLRLSGDAAHVSIDLKDAFERLKISGAVSRLDATAAGYPARQLELAFALDIGPPLQLTLKRLAFAAPRGGRVAVEASLKDTAFSATTRFEKLPVDAYIPEGTEALLAGELDGRLVVDGDFGPGKQRVALKTIELALARRAGAGLPKRLRISGQVDATPDRARVSRLKIDVPGATASIQGQFGLAKKAIDLSLRAAATDLARLLATFGLPPLGKTADFSAHVTGRLDTPNARGQVVLKGVGIDPFPPIPEVVAKWSFGDGAVRLDSFRADAFGGKVEARGLVRLFNRTIEQSLRAPLIEGRVDGKQIDLGVLLTGALGQAVIQGRVDLAAEVKGPADRLRARVSLPAGAELRILGEPWTLGGIDIESDLREVTIRRLRLTRAGGGEVDVGGRVKLTGDMGFTVTIRDFPIAALPGLAAAGVPIEGRLSARLQGKGTAARPTLTGEIDLRGVSVAEVALGDAHLDLTSEKPGRVSVRGNLFGRLAVAFDAEMKKDGLHGRGDVTFDKLVLEQLVPPKMAADLGDARGLVTGRVAVELVPGRDPTVDVNLSALELSVARPRPPGARTTERIFVRNSTPLRLKLQGSRIELAESVLSTQGGELRLRAKLDDKTLDAAVAGFLNLELLQPFVGAPLERLGGDVRLALSARGSKERPRLEGQVNIASPVTLRLVGLDYDVTIPSGSLSLTPGEVTLAGLQISFENSTLGMSGKLALDDDMKPKRFELATQGEVSVRLLESFSSGAITESSGKLRIEARVSGTAEAPQVDARLVLGRMRMRLRDLDREVEVESGTVELKSNELVLKDIRAIIDGQGRLLIGTGGVEPGRIAFRKLLPTVEIASVKLPLQGQGLTFVVPGSVVLDDLNLGLVLTGDPTSGFQLSGEVRVASGRYIQDFTMRAFVISPSVNESSARPVFEGKPLLERLALDLRVRTIGDSFTVQNNLAPEIHMILDLHVGGTLARPEIGGDVRPTDGRFHILGIRGDFVLTPNVNHITFVDTRSIADGDTPELNLEAENLVTDAAGREHTVRMRITGPIGQARIDMSSDTGLDRNQTMLLLISGRTTDVRSPVTFGPNPSTGADVVGQITRDSVADFLEPYIDDTLQLLTGRKLNLRPTVGPDGFELRLGARMSRQLDMQLSFLRGFQSQRRYRGEGSVWLTDYVTLRLFGEQITQSPQQGIVEQVSSLNLELSLDFPLRLGSP